MNDGRRVSFNGRILRSEEPAVLPILRSENPAVLEILQVTRSEKPEILQILWVNDGGRFSSERASLKSENPQILQNLHTPRSMNPADILQNLRTTMRC